MPDDVHRSPLDPLALTPEVRNLIRLRAALETALSEEGVEMYAFAEAIRPGMADTLFHFMRAFIELGVAAQLAAEAVCESQSSVTDDVKIAASDGDCVIGSHVKSCDVAKAHDHLNRCREVLNAALEKMLRARAGSRVQAPRPRPDRPPGARGPRGRGKDN